ncbi:DEAD/DEAH box helicase [Cellulomonas terrae]|uniref:Helicase/UvrB N-terminal domain-containing protein n=1 Tax=Cellulomonas terrae TaxID=311234 RepID=A0A511JP11_9CELL|nr:DEAD/DEAH box helicase family protein [Cellulomonas terrae]GEL99771.1 hypothetical protein CTE05_33180 [Cellulomonas terrae]
MKYTLKDYQVDGVLQVLGNLGTALGLYARGQESAVALTAPTGSGKTVMAAAIIESLFFGSDDFEADPTATVIWFSDDPNLNDQSRTRLTQASDRLTYDRLVTVRAGLWRPVPMLDAGKVYFLNTQQLARGARLTRGWEERGGDATLFDNVIPPDDLAWNIWETIANTVDQEDRTLYLVLDEAHRGFNTRTSTERATIVSRLVNGIDIGQPIPIVLGISATIDRFREAMKNLETSAGYTRRTFEVSVNPERVVDSGLLKDTVVLDIPAEAGNFDTVLVTRAARKLRESSERWVKYANSQNSADTVAPLMVLQVPNLPDPLQIGAALDAVAAEIPGLGLANVRHVFGGGGGTEEFGSWVVDWIEPQRVEETKSVRVLVAKEAISTGWDCPRAEVLVSFRPAKDHTHITQMLGRMIRTPLARRVPGDERLNAVDCILPFFDRTTAGNVVKYMTGLIPEIPGGAQKVVLDGRELHPNLSIPQRVWEEWDGLPTLVVPQRGVAPVKRLVLLAQELSNDSLQPGAVGMALQEMHAVLDGYAVRYQGKLDDAVSEILRVHGQTLVGARGGSAVTYTSFVETADDRAIGVGFDFAKKAFGGELAMSYLNHHAGEDDDLRDSYVTTAALATVKEIRERLDAEADKMSDEWFDRYRVAIRGLSDERQQVYEDVRALAANPQITTLRRPRTRIEDFAVAGPDELLAWVAAPTVEKHLMSDERGQFPVGSLNEWEQDVVRAEIARPDSVAWYRNPSRPAVDSLGIVYRDDLGNWRSMHADFIFFNEIGGEVKASIVDPHGHHLEDSMIKLRALADFANEFGDRFHRIEALDKVGGRMRLLDLKDSDTRATVRSWTGAVEALYLEPVARNYS